MASTKNSNRRKRKYGDPQKNRTAKNKQNQLKRHDLLQVKMMERTESLIGSHVAVRVKDQVKPLVGTVVEVLHKSDEEYPKGAVRKYGAYLKVRTTIGDLVRSRSRIKLIK